MVLTIHGELSSPAILGGGCAVYGAPFGGINASLIFRRGRIDDQSHLARFSIMNSATHTATVMPITTG